jgi:hypothetical protein
MRRVALAAVLMLSGCLESAAAGPSPRDGGLNLEAQRAELQRKIDAMTADGAEVLDKAAFLQEQLGDVLLQMGRKAEAIAEYRKAAAGYSRTPEGTAMPQIRSDRAKSKADKLEGRPSGQK